MNFGTLTYECMHVEESIYYVLYILHYYLRNATAFNCASGRCRIFPASSLTEPRVIQGQWLGWDLSAARIGTRSNGAAGWAGPFAR